jgi:hypothetical protein
LYVLTNERELLMMPRVNPSMSFDISIPMNRLLAPSKEKQQYEQ